MRLPESVDAVIFRKRNKVIEFLILHYNKAKGGFWETLTGGREEREELIETLRREIKEETGIVETQIIRIIPNIYYYEWEANSTLNKEYFFGVEVNSKAKVILSPEHVEYLWCSAEKAKSMLKWGHMKEAIDKAMRVVLTNK